MKRNLVEITTADTKKTYTFDYGCANDNIPQLWEVSLSCKFLDNYGRTGEYSGLNKQIYLERETLENAGLVPQSVERKGKAEQLETAEDLIIRLLSHLGFYPTE